MDSGDGPRQNLINFSTAGLGKEEEDVWNKRSALSVGVHTRVALFPRPQKLDTPKRKKNEAIDNCNNNI